MEDDTNEKNDRYAHITSLDAIHHHLWFQHPYWFNGVTRWITAPDVLPEPTAERVEEVDGAKPGSSGESK